MKTKEIICTFIAAVMTFSVTACGNNKENSSDSNSVKSSENSSKTQNNSDTLPTYTRVIDGGGATLKVYTNRDDRVNDGTLQEITKSFEKANNCKVEYLSPEKYEETIQKKIKTSDYGDVVFMPNNITKDELAEYFEPLGEYDELSKKYRWTSQRMTDDGEVYGLAIGGSVTGLLYNKKLWSNAGYSEEKGNLPKTPEEFKKALNAVKKSNPDCYPLLTDIADNWVTGKWNDWAVSASGDPAYNQKLLDENTDILSQDSYYYKVNRLMFDIYSDKDLIESAEDLKKTDMWAQAKKLLAQGKIGCMVLGSWAITQFEEYASEDTKADVGYMPIPFTAEDGKQYSELCADYFMGVSNKSENTELAKAYVKWFIEYSGFPESETMVSTLLSRNLPDKLAGWEGNIEFFEEARASDGYDGVFDKIYSQTYNSKNNNEFSGIFKKGELDKFIDDSDKKFDNYSYIIARAAINGADEKQFMKICNAANKSWTDIRGNVFKKEGLKNRT